MSQSDLFRLNADDDFLDVEAPRSSYGYDPEDSRDRMRQPKRFERSLEGPDSRDGKSRFDSNYGKPSTSRFVRDYHTLLFLSRIDIPFC